MSRSRAIRRALQDPEDFPLARLLVERGLVDEAKVEECLRLQEQTSPRVPLGAVLVRERVLTASQLAELLRARRDEPTPPEGKALGTRYLLMREIGRGGMGRVYKAYDLQLDRAVALKRLDPSASAERFLREARAMAQLRHPHIVPVYDIGRDGDGLFFTMDLIDGVTLRESRPGRRRLVEFAAQVADALAFAHSKGILHRDVKPDNILIDRSGCAWLADFGLAREVNADAHTTTGVMFGTPAYMSPEHAAGVPSAIGPQSDVYSLGAVLYEGITGRPPHDGKSTYEIVRKVMEEDPVPPGSLVPDLEPELDAIVLKALDRDRDRRYAGAAELRADLQAFLDRRGAHSTVAHRPLRRWVLLAVAAVLLGAIGVAALVTDRVGRARDFDRSRAAAERAFAEGDWGTAAAEASRALEIRHDESLARIDAESRSRIAERERRERALERVRPLEDLVTRTRASYYIPTIDIAAERRVLEQALEALEGESRDPEAWAVLGRGWYIVGDSVRAEMALLRAEALGSRDAWTAYCLARIYLERSLTEELTSVGGEPVEERKTRSKAWLEKALELLRRPSESWAGATEVDRHVASAYEAMAGNEPRFYELCEEGLRKFGGKIGSEEYWNLRGWQRGPKHQHEDYTEALKIRPHYAWACFMRGVSWQELGDTTRALSDFTRAIEINPYLAEAHVDRGFLLEDLGRVDEAIADYDAALRLSPLPAAYNLRGVARKRKGDLDAALADFDEAIRQRPRYAGAYINRANVKSAKKDHAGAVADCDAALAIHPRLAEAYHARGEARRHAGDPRAAIADFDEALKIDPELVVSYNQRGVARRELKDPQGAIADFDQALRIRPKYAIAFANRGGAKEELGDLKGAIEDYQKALDMEPATWPLRAQVVNRIEFLKKALERP